MDNSFFKYPSTPHLTLLGSVIVRNDKVMSTAEMDAFLQHEIIIEEKIDGANLGISFDVEGNLLLQNRGSYLTMPYRGQWKKLSEWLSPRIDIFFEYLGDSYILFGEWCYAQHSVFYNQLPDLFLGFDLFDKNQRRFFSVERRNQLLDKLEVVHVPLLGKKQFSSLQAIISKNFKSQCGNIASEGVYLRYDKGKWLEKRCKIVRESFIQSHDKHWSKTSMKPNRVLLKTT